jgi:histidinol dehydrogenase
MLNRLDLRGVTSGLTARLPRPIAGGSAPLDEVRAILADVQERGDTAVRELTARFDGVELGELLVDGDECQAALARIPAELREALEVAHGSIAAYHRRQVAAPIEHASDGLAIRSFAVPVDRAGCYVPGGRASYPSTVLMTATVAWVAGVEQIALCVPPDRDTGMPPDASLAAAAIAGVDEVYRVGGAQAIAAFAYGTESIPPVDVIVGPGNTWVATAKRLVAAEGRVGIPSSFAGPSEVVVVADASCPVPFAAIDVMVQAEHGPDGLAWLVTWDPSVADAVSAAVAEMTARSPRRADLEATFAQGGYCVLVDGPEQAMEVANAIAPEHLELLVADPGALVSLVRHAGAVFCGVYSPASLGDYVAGPSHVLPTFGSARFAGALTVSDFTKHVHVITADAAALGKVGGYVVTLAEAEGLPAHADSIRMRLSS